MIDKLIEFKDDHIHDGQFFIATTDAGRAVETVCAQITLSLILVGAIIFGFYCINTNSDPVKVLGLENVLPEQQIKKEEPRKTGI